MNTFYVSRARAILQIRASFPHDPDAAELKARWILDKQPEGIICEGPVSGVDILGLEVRVYSLMPSTV